MNIQEKHIHLIELVNKSTTREEHSLRDRDLRYWRIGVEDAGLKLDLIGADMYYINQGIDRPMCCGVWLDWEPSGK